MLKRILNFLAAFSIIETIGRHPVAFAGSMLLLGAGGVATGIVPLNPPTTLPQPGIQFPQANSYSGTINTGFVMPAGSMQLPSTPTGSFMFQNELMVDPSISASQKWAFGSANSVSQGLLFSTPSSGSVALAVNRTVPGSGSVAQPYWLATVGYQPISGDSLSYVAGTGNNAGFYIWQGSDGCESTHGTGAREPQGSLITKQSSTVAAGIAFADSGFLCSTNSSGQAPQINAAAVPGLGVTQLTGASSTPAASATTCASNAPTANEFTVTVHLGVAHGLNPGQSFVLTGFTPSGFNETYTALSGTSGATLVGLYANGTGTCPATSGITEGSLTGGTSGTITLSAPATNPFNLHNVANGNLGTGIQFKPAQRVCGWVGEFGSDSLFPGAQFAKYTDITGADLPGSPAISPWVNMNVGTFNGYTLSGLQSGTGTFTASVANTMGAITASSATYSAAATGIGTQTGSVTFVLSGAHGLLTGDTFTVSGATPTGYNQVYQVLTGSAGSTLIGSLATGGNLASPGAYTSGAAFGSGNTLTVTTTPTNVLLLNSNALLTGAGIISSGVNIVSQSSGAVAGAGVYVLANNIGTTTAATLTGTVITPTPALVVTSMPTFNITSASYSGGLVTFTMSGNTPFQIGSEIKVSGMSVAAFNQTYIAVTGTNGPGSTTVVGNALSGAAGVPQAVTPSPATATGGTMKTVITPGMEVVGSTGYSIISPYGAFGSTGVGDTGTYGLTVTQALTFTMVGSLSTTPLAGGSGTLTVTGAAPVQQLAIGTILQSSTGGALTTTKIVGYGTGTGSTGTYGVDTAQTVASGTITAGDAIGSSFALVSGAYTVTTSPVNIYAAAAFYYNVAASGSSAGGGSVSAHSQSTMGDFVNLVGSTSSALALPFAQNLGWGGTVANVGMYSGPVPMTAAGAPDPTELNKLCLKTQNPYAWASGHSGAWRSLYKMNDLATSGAAADHSIAEFTGSASGTALTVSSTQFGSLPTVTAGSPVVVVSGAGFCPNSVCPTIVSGSGGSYTLSASVGTVGSEAMSAGSFQPATPISASFLGFTGSISSSTLTVTDFNASWTGTAHVLAQASGANALIIDSTNSGTLAQGQCLSDVTGAINSTTPLCITGGSGTIFSIQGGAGQFNYYSAGIASEHMASTIVSITPGNFVMGGVSGPVQVTGLSSSAVCTGPNATWGLFPGCGTYAVVNPSGVSVSNAALTMSGVSASGAIAPGAALTVQNPGFGEIYPTSAIGSSTGNMQFNGEYDSTLMGGTPSHIQALVADSPNLPPTPHAGCSACNWTNITGPAPSSAKWSGTVNGIPNGGPYTVFFRAENGQTYIDLPNAVCVGWNIAVFGEGNAVDQLLNTGNANQTYFPPVCSQLVGWQTALTSSQNVTNSAYVPGPPIVGTYSFSTPTQTIVDRFSVVGTSFSAVGDGLSWLIQGANTILGGAGVGVNNMTRNGTGFQSVIYDGVTSSQTIGLGDGATTVFASGAGFGGSLSTSAGAVANTVTGSIAGNTMTITAASTGTNNWFYIDRGQQVTCGSCATGTVITGLGTGTGLGGTYTVSPSQTVSSTTLTITHNNLDFNAAWGYGAQITGTYSSGAVGPTLTVNSLTAGSMAPLLVVSDITNSSTLKACLTGCSLLGTQTAGSTWLLSDTNLVGDTSPTAMTVAQTGGALYPAVNPQPAQIPVDTGNGTVGTTALIKYGTFQVLVNGSVVCQDSSTFAYNIQAGNCTGAGVSGWVNYLTGGYAITFTTAPASNAAVVAKWVNLQSGDSTLSHEQIPWVGDSTATGGVLASVAARTGGVNAYLNGQQGTGGWPNNNLNYARALNWVFGTKMAALHNGQTNQPLLTTGQWRGEGPVAFQGLFSYAADLDLEQLDQDEVTKSEWSGTIAGTTASAVLTLTAASTGPMWEGEVIECNPFALTCAIPQGAEITSIASGTWGASGSTYNIVSVNGNFSNIASAIPIHNAMYYPGGGGYVGPYNDLTVQSGAGGAGNYSVETGGGISGALRYGHRVGIESGAVLAGDLTKGSTPTLSRTLPSPNPCSTNTSAATSPCFDLGNGAASWPASHAATWTGKTITISGGLSANARPFVPGMALSCSGCNSGLVALAVSLPPTQSTVSGAGQIGQTFTVTASGTIGGGGSGTITGGCLGTSGVGSNCIDFNIKINTAGTYGTTASLNTCGVNNLVGTNTNLPTASGFIFPNGPCAPSGVGSLVRGFRIGGNQTTDTPFSNSGLGSVYDFGPDPDPENLVVNQNQAFTCHIVAATWVQCIHGPIYVNGLFSSRGQWSSGSTFASYGDPYAATGFIGAIVAPMGGQSFPFTPGSGYLGTVHYVTGGVCTAMASPTGANATAIPAMGFDVSGGSIVNAYPTTLGNGMQSSCTFPISFSGTGKITSSSGTNATFTQTVAPTGGAIAPGEVISINGQVLTVKPIVGAIVNTGVSTTQGYAVFCSTTCINDAGHSFTVGPLTGTGGAISTVPIGWSTGATGAANSEGNGVIGTYDSDTNLMGTLLYDNSGVVGNPLQHMFDLPAGGQESPGLPVRPFGMRRGPAVAG